MLLKEALLREILDEVFGFDELDGAADVGWEDEFDEVPDDLEEPVAVEDIDSLALHRVVVFELLGDVFSLVEGLFVEWHLLMVFTIVNHADTIRAEFFG